VASAAAVLVGLGAAGITLALGSGYQRALVAGIPSALLTAAIVAVPELTSDRGSGGLASVRPRTADYVVAPTVATGSADGDQ
jgi:hypothetical protein